MPEFPERDAGMDAARAATAGLATATASIATVSISAGSAALTGAPHFKQKRLVGGSSAVQIGQRCMADLSKAYLGSLTPVVVGRTSRTHSEPAGRPAADREVRPTTTPR
jgi:hypothetical protein